MMIDPPVPPDSTTPGSPRKSGARRKLAPKGKHAPRGAAGAGDRPGAGGKAGLPGKAGAAGETRGSAGTDDLVAVARLGAPRGLKGHLNLHSYSGEFDHLAKLRRVVLVSGDAADSVERRTPRDAEIVDIMGGSFAMSAAFKGYDSPEKARALTGLDIMVPRSGAAPLGESEWYVSDLVGMDFTLDGKKVATLAGILDGGPDPLLEAELPGGRIALVPFRKEFVGAVDLGARTIELLDGWILE